MAYVHGLLDEGLGLDTVLIELLAPVARRLGELWEADEIDFVDVTVGTSRLQQILHHFALPPERDAGTPARRVLLLPTPTEQHTFGLLMVAEFFRREGWQVWGGTPLEERALKAMVADQWFALIGFSLSCERSVAALCATIKLVRRYSRNRCVKIIVGGPLLSGSDPASFGIEADMVVADAREAVALAESAVSHDAKRQGA
jgi:MerR family transcriptional regulator, light-induced transcriptional regulator